MPSSCREKIWKHVKSHTKANWSSGLNTSNIKQHTFQSLRYYLNLIVKENLFILEKNGFIPPILQLAVRNCLCGTALYERTEWQRSCYNKLHWIRGGSRDWLLFLSLLLQVSDSCETLREAKTSVQVQRTMRCGRLRATWWERYRNRHKSRKCELCCSYIFYASVKPHKIMNVMYVQRCNLIKYQDLN